MINEIFYGVGHSAVASQPCPSGHITADKRLRCFAPSPKLPSVTSFIRKTIAKMTLRSNPFEEGTGVKP